MFGDWVLVPQMLHLRYPCCAPESRNKTKCIDSVSKDDCLYD